MTGGVDPVDWEAALGEVEADRDNLHRGRFLFTCLHAPTSASLNFTEPSSYRDPEQAIYQKLKRRDVAAPIDVLVNAL